MQFCSNNKNSLDLDIVHKNGYIPNISEIKFLGLHINNILSWSLHIEKILPKLSSACYAMRSVKPYVSQQMLKIIYYSYFHSIMSYGIIFWGHLVGGIRVFRLQKRIIRIMMGHSSRDSCRQLFIDLKMLPQSSLYILSYLLIKIMVYSPQIIKYITIAQDNAATYTNQLSIWLSFKNECCAKV